MSAIEADRAASEIPAGRSSAATRKAPFYRKLYVQVLIAIALGAALGYLQPAFSVSLKPYGDAFVKAIKVVVAPIIFTTIVVGINIITQPVILRRHCVAITTIGIDNV